MEIPDTAHNTGAKRSMPALLRLSFLALLLSGAAMAQLLPLKQLKLGSNGAEESVDVIVQYNQAPSKGLVAKVLALGASLIKELPVINAVAVTVPISELDELSRQPGVIHVSRDFEMRAAMTSVNAASGAAVAHNYGWNGAGVGIALIDSGISRHADLPIRVVYTKDFVEPLGLGVDRHGHGTHVAGIIFGQGTNTRGVDDGGIAPRAHLVNLRVLNEQGSGRESDVIDAIGTAIKVKNLYNIRVINLSLGRPVFESWVDDPLCLAVKKAWDAGIVVVVAAGNYGRLNEVGNEGYGTITAPGNTPAVITVGAMNTLGTPNAADDVMASYSSKGPSILDHVVKPDLVAPGNRISSTIADSTLAREHPELVQSNRKTLLGVVRGQSDYMQLSGTSMAAPVVAGAAALLLQQNPQLSPDSVKARLMKTASKNFPNITTIYDPATRQSFVIQNDIFTVGAGYLDIWAALNDSTTVARGKTAESPAVAYDSRSGEFRLASGQTAVWGRDETFGETAVWGRNIIEGSTAVWGRNVNGSTAVWGRGAIWGNTAVWGRSGAEGYTAVWGRNSVDGNTAVWGRNNAEGSTAVWGRDSAEGSTAVWGRNAADQAQALSSILLHGE